ncbi:hypothetical protein Tcan_00915, partial [Toxocara canis]
ASAQPSRTQLLQRKCEHDFYDRASVKGDGRPNQQSSPGDNSGKQSAEFLSEITSANSIQNSRAAQMVTRALNKRKGDEATLIRKRKPRSRQRLLNSEASTSRHPKSPDNKVLRVAKNRHVLSATLIIGQHCALAFKTSKHARTVAKKLKLCRRCLRKDHYAESCPSRRQCHYCRSTNHHQALCTSKAKRADFKDSSMVKVVELSSQQATGSIQATHATLDRNYSRKLLQLITNRFCCLRLQQRSLIHVPPSRVRPLPFFSTLAVIELLSLWNSHNNSGYPLLQKSVWQSTVLAQHPFRRFPPT